MWKLTSKVISMFKSDVMIYVTSLLVT